MLESLGWNQKPHVMIFFFFPFLCFSSSGSVRGDRKHNKVCSVRWVTRLEVNLFLFWRAVGSFPSVCCSTPAVSPHTHTHAKVNTPKQFAYADTCPDTHLCMFRCRCTDALAHTYRCMPRSSCFPTSSSLWENPCWSVIDSALPAPLVCSPVSHTHTHTYTGRDKGCPDVLSSYSSCRLCLL